ncbi:lytic murein transglycosylase, partial [bacterium]|nr:lytic murein transglycosylase [bacterium]
MNKTFLSALACLALLASPSRAGDFSQRQDVADFIAEMHERNGFSTAELEADFRLAKRLPAVLKAIRPPANPAIRSWEAYRNRFVEPKRIALGSRFWRQYQAEFATASQRYGVPEEIIAAIIGVETIYGQHMGRFTTFDALATLAFDYPPRAPLFRRELEALLLLAREEQRNVRDYKGSYAGALGLPQFLPS